MSTPAHQVIERLSHVTPFGLGLWDTAAGRLLSEGLGVTLHALRGTGVGGSVAAVANRLGIFVARGLPGLREWESGSGDAEFWASLPPPLPFLVEVRDRWRRFVPFALHLELPAPRGPVLPPCVADLWLPDPASSSPPRAPAYVPLFSTSSRPVPVGVAAVRAALVDGGTGAPAEHAVLEVRESGRLLGRGVADERGEVAALFAYPEFPDDSPASPPDGAASPPAGIGHAWALEISVRYRRDLPTYSPDPVGTTLADLCELMQQPRATILSISPPAETLEAVLRYGEELVVGERGASLRIAPP
jgi:hypothetical protein